MTERSDGVTDARIQAAIVIAGILFWFLRGTRRGRNGSAAKSPDQREGVFDAQGRAALCRANDRADKRLGPVQSRGTKPTEGFWRESEDGK